MGMRPRRVQGARPSRVAPEARARYMTPMTDQTIDDQTAGDQTTGDHTAGATPEAPSRDEAAPAPETVCETAPNAKGPEQPPGEIGGPKGPEPTRYGDWESRGRCSDF